jgi:hypothetical protein
MERSVMAQQRAISTLVRPVKSWDRIKWISFLPIPMALAESTLMAPPGAGVLQAMAGWVTAQQKATPIPARPLW